MAPIPALRAARTGRSTDASAVELATSGELVLTTGDGASLRITAGENVLDHLTSEVSDGRLVLGTDGSTVDLGEVRYELVLPEARAVELSGSGSVQVPAPSALGRARAVGLR